MGCSVSRNGCRTEMVSYWPLREIPLHKSGSQVISVYLVWKAFATLSPAFCPVAPDVARLLTYHNIAIPYALLSGVSFVHRVGGTQHGGGNGHVPSLGRCACMWMDSAGDGRWLGDQRPFFPVFRCQSSYTLPIAAASSASMVLATQLRSRPESPGEEMNR